MLLDEPTASLDPVTEAHVLGNLFAAFDDACIVASVHRLNLLDRFDEILVMSEGRLVAQGTLDALALTSAEFQRLVMARGQHGGAQPEAAGAVGSVSGLSPPPSGRLRAAQAVRLPVRDP